MRNYWFVPRVRFFNHVRFNGDWELNFIWPALNIRVERSQSAIWWNYEPLVMWLAKPYRATKMIG